MALRPGESKCDAAPTTSQTLSPSLSSAGQDPHEIEDSSSTSRQLFASESANVTMYRSTTPPESSAYLKFTKTGRVSKATKGERVHGCDACGKIYTRAEHLRRHKKNHNPGSLPCDVPGCGKFFVREDLLQRHQQRHAEPNASTYRDGSVDDHLPNQSHVRETTPPQCPISTASTGPIILASEPTMSHASHTPSSSRSQSNKGPFGAIPLTDISCAPFNLKVHTGYVPLDHLPRQARTSAPMLSSYTTESSSGNCHWDPLTPPSYPYSSPDIAVSPQQPYYQTLKPHLHHTSNASMVDLPMYSSSTRSPVSANSNLPVTLEPDEVWQAAFADIGTPTSDVSYTQTSGYTSHLVGRPSRVGSLTTATAIGSAEERDIIETAELQTLGTGMVSPDFGPNLSVYNSEQQYLEAFWQAVHPVWPIVHHASFVLHGTNPLLRAAMVALGAHSTGDTADVCNARILHERCMKVLRKRTNNHWHSFRIEDMQAILLIELYSLFKSRRPPTQLSRCFENVFRRLANDAEAYPSTLPGFDAYGDIQAEVASDLQHEAKCRLLVAYYILDRQHALFFGRQPSGCLPVPGDQLPYPRTSVFWEATSIGANFADTQHDLTSYDYACEVMNATMTTEVVAMARQDTFRSMHLITCLVDTVNTHVSCTLPSVSDEQASRLLHTIDESPRSQMIYHLSLLCKLTPVRDLLAVAGETWIMSEKIKSQSEYSCAQSDVREWVGERRLAPQSAHSAALSHALAILDLYRQFPRMRLLAQEWAVYLSSLVVWINAYLSHDMQPRVRIGASSAMFDLERTVTALVQAQLLGSVSWSDASCVLLWTKNKLESVNIPNSCGLTNGALDVLEKLISRGHEGSWLC